MTYYGRYELDVDRIKDEADRIVQWVVHADPKFGPVVDADPPFRFESLSCSAKSKEEAIQGIRKGIDQQHERYEKRTGEVLA